MEVFRLTRTKFYTSLSGKGAAEKGARWNSIGLELIYTAANRSLAMAGDFRSLYSCYITNRLLDDDNFNTR